MAKTKIINHRGEEVELDLNDGVVPPVMEFGSRHFLSTVSRNHQRTSPMHTAIPQAVAPVTSTSETTTMQKQRLAWPTMPVAGSPKMLGVRKSQHQ
jgi:hypothetical protein